MDPQLIDQLSKRFMSQLPSGLKSVQQDIEDNFRGVLQGAIGKMNLVTREEFDVQTAVLLRTRKKLEQMLERLSELEAENND